MDEQRGRHVVLLRSLLCVLASGAALVWTLRGGSRPLDVALWAVLSPLGVGAALALTSWLWGGAHRTHRTQRPHGGVVVPDPVAHVHTTPDPAVQARDAAVEQARADLLAAKDRGAPLEDLLVLARALHEARLDLARATASAGGHVPQDLRDELALRERRTTAPSS